MRRDVLDKGHTFLYGGVRLVQNNEVNVRMKFLGDGFQLIWGGDDERRRCCFHNIVWGYPGTVEILHKAECSGGVGLRPNQRRRPQHRGPVRTAASRLPSI